LPGNHTADGGLPAVGCLFSFCHMRNGESMQEQNPITGPTDAIVPPTKPVTGPTKPATGPVQPITGSLFTSSEIPLLTQERISHGITALAIVLSTIISIMVWYGSNPNDDWARRWVLVAIPFISAFGLLIGWRLLWRDTLLGIELLIEIYY
jgi:hypothetical protein